CSPPPQPSPARGGGSLPRHLLPPPPQAGEGRGGGAGAPRSKGPHSRCSSIVAIVAQPHRRRSRAVMSTQAMGPATGWSWLARAVNLGRANPKAVIGAIALVALVA